MNIYLINDYLAAKATYEDRESRMDKAVTKAFTEYKTQKHAVSTRKMQPWSGWHVSEFSLTTKWADLDIYYGWSDSNTKRIRLPIELIQLAAEAGADAALKSAVADVIRVEGEDIARREAEKVVREAELLQKGAEEETRVQREREEQILAEAEEIRNRREQESTLPNQLGQQNQHPASCRNRLIAEGKSYARSTCTGCGGNLRTGFEMPVR